LGDEDVFEVNGLAWENGKTGDEGMDASLFMPVFEFAFIHAANWDSDNSPAARASVFTAASASLA